MRDVDLVVVCMDDFDVVLDMEFLLQHKTIPMTLVQCMVLTTNNTTVIQAKNKQLSEVGMILALQLKKGLSGEEPTFMVIPLVVEKIETWTVPVKIQKVLNDYVDIMPPKLSQSFLVVRRTQKFIFIFTSDLSDGVRLIYD